MKAASPSTSITVIKCGTQVVLSERMQFAARRLAPLAQYISQLQKKGHRFLIVSSGAVGLGRRLLRSSESRTSQTTSQKQALAAIGQSQLIAHWQKLFRPYRVPVGQLLITARDLGQPESFHNLTHCIQELLNFGVIPIINENDSVAVDELKSAPGKEKNFGDNDNLAALVAARIQANLLVLLSSVDGIYTADPQTHPKATRIAHISSLQDLARVNATGKSQMGRGGMSSKLKACRIAMLSGVPVYMSSGLKPQGIKTVLRSEILWNKKQKGFSQDSQSIQALTKWGTFVGPVSKLNARDQHIGFGAGIQGTVYVNSGAEQALTTQNASLLPAGVSKIMGEFQKGEVISIMNDAQIEIARGYAGMSSTDLRLRAGKNKAALLKLGLWTRKEEVIHRNHMIFFAETQS